MSDVALVGLFGALSTVLVALFGAIFPGAREARARREERDAKAVTLRYERAIAFVDILTEFARGSLNLSSGDVHKAASRFIATLRPGEGDVAVYVRKSVARVGALNKAGDRINSTNSVADKLFDWLRGDLASGDLDVIER